MPALTAAPLPPCGHARALTTLPDDSNCLATASVSSVLPSSTTRISAWIELRSIHVSVSWIVLGSLCCSLNAGMTKDNRTSFSTSISVGLVLVRKAFVSPYIEDACFGPCFSPQWVNVLVFWNQRKTIRRSRFDACIDGGRVRPRMVIVLISGHEYRPFLGQIMRAGPAALHQFPSSKEQIIEEASDRGIAVDLNKDSVRKIADEGVVHNVQFLNRVGGAFGRVGNHTVV